MRRLLVFVLAAVLCAVVVASAASLGVDGGVIQGFEINVDLAPSTTAADLETTTTIPSAG